MTDPLLPEGARRTAPSLLSVLFVPRPELRGLAGGVAFLAVLELLVGGFLLPAIRLPYEGEAIVYWTSIGATFARNLAAIVAVAVATLYVGSFVRDSSFAPASRRLTIGVLAVLAIPVQAISLLVHVTPEMVFLSYTGTYFLCVLTVLSAVQWPGALAPRIGVTLALLPPTAAFLSTVVSRVMEGAGSFSLGILLLRTLDLGGEGLVIGVALLLPMLLIRPEARTLSRPPGLIAAVLALLPCAAYVAVQIYGGDRVGELTQATMGIELAFWAPLYLAALFGFSTTVLVNLLPATRPQMRGSPDVGVGLVLIAAAGQDAHTPYRLVLLLLGFQMLAAGVVSMREA